MASKKKYVYDRFISSKVINSLLRPQRAGDCSISAMAVAMNSLFMSNITFDDILNQMNWDIQEDVRAGHIGNDKIVLGMNSLCERFRLKGKADILFNKIPNKTSDRESIWKELKDEISSPTTVLIYHALGSYSNIAGYYEEPKDLTAHGKKSYYFRRNWLILAENKISSDTPIRMINWVQAKRDINENSWNGIIRLQSTGEQIRSKQKVSKAKRAPGIEIMSESIIGNKSNQNASARLKLSRWGMKDLNDKIFNELETRIGDGMTLHQAFWDLSEKSEEVLEYKLTAKAIEGRYNRHPEVKDMRKNRD